MANCDLTLIPSFFNADRARLLDSRLTINTLNALSNLNIHELLESPEDYWPPIKEVRV